MAASLPASLLPWLAGLHLGAAGGAPANRVSLEGLALQATPDGGSALTVAACEVASLRLARGPVTLALARLALRTLTGATAQPVGAAASAELDGLQLEGRLARPAHAPAGASPASAATGWTLAPLAGAEGMLQARIVDAHLLFDADVRVPLRQGAVDFNQATVEHVGPDSRMGVSRMGLYVDAPNGRSYLMQFPAAPVAGVRYERRGALPGPWASDRGALQLQPLAESLLRQGSGPALTAQARLLLDRTAVSGHVQLGDGRLQLPGLGATLDGQAQGRNLVRLQSPAVGKGLTLEIEALAARDLELRAAGLRLACDAAQGAATLRLFVEGGQLRFALAASRLVLTGLRMEAATTA